MEVSAIDFVVPMVFNSDRLWQKDFLKAGSRYDEGNAVEFVRWRSWGTEHLLVRCVKRFMPFVRNIYVILARESQRRPWMDREGVTVVYHRDIVPERFLPLFNSCALEMFIHRIPGLSERFIYGNDDMFPVADMREEDFFEGMVPCLHHEERDFPASPNIFHNICRNGLNFVGREFGVRFDRTWLRGGHGMTPMLRSTWEYLWHIGGDRIMGSVTPFRSPRNFIQWLCPWWHHMAGNYIDKPSRTTYVSTRDSVDDVVRAIMRCDGVVCVNDNECEKDYMRYGSAVSSALLSRLKS